MVTLLDGVDGDVVESPQAAPVNRHTVTRRIRG